MKKLIFLILIALAFGACSDIIDSGVDSNAVHDQSNPNTQKQNSTTTSQSSMWVTAYLACYNHYAPPGGNWGNLPTDEIDWSAFTQLNYFSLSVNADGSLSTIQAYHNMSPDRINAIVSAAHSHDKPVLFTIGGWGNHAGFSTAIQPGTRSTLISNLVSTIKTWGFDGVDLDLEPIKSSDVDNYIAFVNELHKALQNIKTPVRSTPILSTATNWQPEMYAKIQDQFDQINLMTYDYSGAWPGWTTWHNAPISNGGQTFPNNTNKTLPSIEKTVAAFTNAGVAKNKLGIGIDFYGYVWNGVSAPGENWGTTPTVTDNVPYHDIMDQYYSPELFKWDDKAKAAYLSIDNGLVKKFISFDNERSIDAKVNYIKQNGLGGAILWELSGGYRKDQPAGERDLLLQAVKNAVSSAATSPTPSDTQKPNVSITTPADGAQVSGSVNLAADATDNQQVQSVSFKVDGSNIGNSISTSPYALNWNSSQVSDGAHTITATATDASGNLASTSITVTVANSGSNTTPSSASLTVYEDAIKSPWINSSWNASINFSSSTQVKSGTHAVEVAQNAWGGLSFHSGNWGATESVSTDSYKSLTFYIYSKDATSNFNIYFENENGYKFPKVKYGTVPKNTWVAVDIPISDLNPENKPVSRLNFMETSGSARTYYIDQVQFTGDQTSASTLAAPQLTSPTNSATGISTSASLNWDAIIDASSYTLQIADDSGFSNILNQQNVSTNSFSVSGLVNSTTYYWRVKSTNSSQTSSWSQVYSFTTASTGGGSTVNAVNIYDDNLVSPWINASWNATVNYASTGQTESGTHAIKVDQNAWGGFSLHNGNWGASNDINTGQYTSLVFSIYSDGGDENFKVYFGNDNKDTFPKISSNTITTNHWTKISIPISELNPDILAVHRISIMETSGSSRTYYVDNVHFE